MYENYNDEELQFFQYDSNDYTACPDGASCIKYDCHTSGTGWSMAGLSKVPDDYLLEALTKNHGQCLWNQETLEFMASMTAGTQGFNWPSGGCTNTALQFDDGTPAYVRAFGDMNNAGGYFTIGLFKDEYCREEYEGDELKKQEMLSCYATSTYNSQTYQWKCDKNSFDKFKGEQLDMLNGALDVFKACQPNVATCDSSQETYFFDVLKNLEAKPATKWDLELGNIQRSIVEVDMGGVIYGQNGNGVVANVLATGNTTNYTFAATSFAVLIIGSVLFVKALRIKKKARSPSLQAALMDSAGADDPHTNGVMA